jgi:hypothetical protein
MGVSAVATATLKSATLSSAQLSAISEVAATTAQSASKSWLAASVAGFILSAEDQNHLTGGILPAPISSADKEAAAIKGASGFYNPPVDPQVLSPTISPIAAPASKPEKAAEFPDFFPAFSSGIGSSATYHPNASPPATKSSNVPRRLPPAKSPSVNFSPATTAPGGTNTPPARTQSVQHASNRREYGKLLHTPVSNAAYPVKFYQDAGYNDSFSASQGEAAKAFTEWANGNESQKLSLQQTGLLFMPTQQAQTRGNTSTKKAPAPEQSIPVFGLGTGAAFSQWHSRSRAALMPATGTVPTKFKTSTLPLLPALAAPAMGAGAKAIQPSKNLGQIPKNIRKVLSGIDLSKLLAVLNLAATIHNAALLSTDIVSSLLSFMSNTLKIMGIKDFQGNDINVEDYVRGGIKDLLTAALGAKTIAEIESKWKSYSAIYRAAANLYGSVTSIAYSTLNVLQITGQYVAKIGNSLQKAGVIYENSFSWMSEGLTGRIARLESLENSLNNVSQISSDLDMVSTETLSVKETVKEMKTQKAELDKAVKDAFPKPIPENQPKKKEADRDDRDSIVSNEVVDLV